MIVEDVNKKQPSLTYKNAFSCDWNDIFSSLYRNILKYNLGRGNSLQRNKNRAEKGRMVNVKSFENIFNNLSSQKSVHWKF